MEFRNIINFILSFVVIYVIVNSISTINSLFTTFTVIILEIKLAEWLMERTRKCILYKKVCPKNKAILITGCDSGFGNVLARRMSKLGYFVYATCLSPDSEGAKKLSEECSDNLIVLPMDVTDDRSIEKVKEYINRNLGQYVLWAVINNAGIAQFGQVDWSSLEEFQQVYDVNTAGILRVTKAFLPLLKKSKGRIINLSSAAAHFLLPMLVAYSMSKSAVSVLTSGLRVELASWGVKSICIEPYMYATPIIGKETVYRLVEKSWLSAPKEVTEEYGEDYYKCMKQYLIIMLSVFVSNDVFEVINDMEDAITAEEPLSVYIPGNSVYRFIISILRILPSDITESIQKLLCRMKKPKALTSKGDMNRMKAYLIASKKEKK